MNTIHQNYEAMSKAAPVLPMTRNERLTRRAEAADSLGLLWTAAYWEAVRDGRADQSDKNRMLSERDYCVDADWAEFARLDAEIASEFEARKVAA